MMRYKRLLSASKAYWLIMRTLAACIGLNIIMTEAAEEQQGRVYEPGLTRAFHLSIAGDEECGPCDLEAIAQFLREGLDPDIKLGARKVPAIRFTSFPISPAAQNVNLAYLLLTHGANIDRYTWEVIDSKAQYGIGEHEVPSGNYYEFMNLLIQYDTRILPDYQECLKKTYELILKKEGEKGVGAFTDMIIRSSTAEAREEARRVRAHTMESARTGLLGPNPIAAPERLETLNGLINKPLLKRIKKLAKAYDENINDGEHGLWGASLPIITKELEELQSFIKEPFPELDSFLRERKERNESKEDK